MQQDIPLRQKIFLLLMGFFLFLVVLEIGLRVGGAILFSLQESRNMVSLQQKGTYRIMCVGESTTTFGGNSAYPYQLEEILNQSKAGVKFEVINKGIAGITTLGILRYLETDLGKYKPNMVITMIGINDNGDYLPFENNFGIRIMLRHFRIYKLCSLLWLHLVDKSKDIKIAIQNRNKIKPERVIKVTDFETEYSGNAPVSFPPEPFYQKVIHNSSSGEMSISEVDENLKKIMGINPKDYQEYIDLGQFYISTLSNSNNWKETSIKSIESKAEEVIKKAIEINPNNNQGYVELGQLYMFQKKYLQAEDAFKKAIEIAPANDSIHIELGKLYMYQKKDLQAEETFKRAIEIAPKNDFIYVELGQLYMYQKKYLQAEEAFKKSIEFNSQTGANIPQIRKFKLLMTLYKETGRDISVNEFYKKISKLEEDYYIPVTRCNYQKIYDILSRRGIKYVCVQYPMRSLEPLKKIFGNRDGIIFVDNEKVFKNAIKKATYNKYFLDIFAGDFGHCSEEGNRLLAENVANVIVKEYFHRIDREIFK